ncbi:MAG TPA: hypothetical protein VEJ63_14215 [Planctomycetota bacterium]|nr:hypothetical protein [Planctomycetota bacterium]
MTLIVALVAGVTSLALLCRAWSRPGAASWLSVAFAVMLTSACVQRHVEARRVEENLTWMDPRKKDALETSLMALGGFRGLLADVLWMRATRLQESSRYYELKLLCDFIQKLQPTFTTVHAFQAHNMAYNLARRSMSCEDKWYWIASGIATLEKGLERNQRHYGMWFELGWMYLDRLGDIKMGECAYVRQQELPRIDDLSDEERKRAFVDPKAPKGRARKDENLRWAAWCFYNATLATGDPVPLRSERVFGNCLDRLGHWNSAKPPGERTRWEDWGSEDWWLEVRRRNRARGAGDELAVEQNLRWCMFQQISYFEAQAQRMKDPEQAKSWADRASDAAKRFYLYFPEEKRTMPVLIKEFREREEQLRKLGSSKVRPVEE